jgi:hypothetical protein
MRKKMKIQSTQPEKTQDTIPANIPAEQLEEKFLTGCKKHFLNDNPNPYRLGCPTVAQLRAFADMKLVDFKITEHILSCSPCMAQIETFNQNKAGKA